MAAPVFQLHPADGPAPVEQPNEAEIFPPPSQPLDVARVVLDEHTENGHLLLRRWRGEWWQYRGPHWADCEDEAIRRLLYFRLEHAQYMAPSKKKDAGPEEKPWAPDKNKLDKLLDAMAAPAFLAREVDAPCWLSTGESARGVVPCANGLVDVQTQKITPCTPDYFGTVAIPFDYDPDAGEPVEWLKFLRGIFPSLDRKDAQEIRTLQQWFGYVLSGRLDLQKMLLIVGPPRCGKGTIARILQTLVGEANTSAPTMSGIAQNFGLETSIGKTLMVVGDARMSAQGQETIVERLLSITGQDKITLDRKNKQAWNGTMQARIMVLSNDMPKYGDASGAVASRNVILRLNESFLGREDIEMEGRIRREFPAILKWALRGLADLNTAGRLHEPPAHLEAMRELYDLVSPISAFLRDVCDATDGNATVPFSDLYQEYGAWCSENGRGQKNTAGFSSDLKSFNASLKTDHRPRDEKGRKMPRHVKGLQVSTEWATRVKEATGWKSTGWAA